MPIIELQRRIREVGRIRLGAQKTAKSGKKYPAGLDTFRLTTTDRDTLEAAAQLYGGEVREWADAPGRGQQWELFTESNALPILIPPVSDTLPIDELFSQWYEAWKGGGCEHRCDGQTDSLTGDPCVCDPDPEKRECKPTTRVKVILRGLPGFGTWRLESHGWNAAVELGASVELLGLAAQRNYALPARLRIEPRHALGRPGEAERHFVVPVIDVDVSLEQLGLVTGQQFRELPGADETPVAIGGIRTESTYGTSEGLRPIESKMISADPAMSSVTPAPQPELPPAAQQIDAQVSTTSTLNDKPPPRAPAYPETADAQFSDPHADPGISAPAIGPPTGSDSPPKTTKERPPMTPAQKLAMRAQELGWTEQERHDLMETMYGVRTGNGLDDFQLHNVRKTIDALEQAQMFWDEKGRTMSSATEDVDLVFSVEQGWWIIEGPASEAAQLEQQAEVAANAPAVTTTTMSTGKEWSALVKAKGLTVRDLLKALSQTLPTDLDRPGNYTQLAEATDTVKAHAIEWLNAQ